MEYCIVYFSTLREPFKEEDLIATLEESRQKNAIDGITSVTLYVRGNIIQVLEGRKEAVEALYAQIERDPQHINVTKIVSRPIQERLFAGTSVAYETITTSQLEELKSVVDLDNRQEPINNSRQPFILKLLKVFYESNRYN
ncbi:BLUF domain-containing protein [Spirosoma pomorum]